MPDTRIYALPAESSFNGGDIIPVDDVTRGTRGLPLSKVLQAPITSAGANLTIGPFKRIIRNGTVVSYAGGTIAVPSDGTFFLLHLSTNALSLVSGPGYPGTDYDSILLAQVIRAGGVVTAVHKDDPWGGNMRGERNLAEVLSVASARANLGVSFLFQQGTAITAAGDTALVVADSNTDGVVRYTVTAGSAAYTRTISISSTGAPNGTKVTIMLDMPSAPVNAPTIEIRNQTSSGTLLTTILSGPFARTERIELVYSGSAWIIVSAGPEPHAGFAALAEHVNNTCPTGGIKFDGTLGKISQGVIRGVSLGAGDYSAVIVFRVALNPDAAQNMGLFTFGIPAAGPAQAGQVGVYVGPSSGLYNIGVRDNALALTSGSLVMTPYVGRTVQMAIIRKTGIVSVFIDGAPVPFSTSNPSAQAQAQVLADTPFLVGNFGLGSLSYRERISSFQLYNRALTSAELRAVAVRGVAVEDRNALGAVYQSNFASTADGWVATTGLGSNGSVLANQTIGGQTECLKLISGTAANAYSFYYKSNPGTAPRGRMLRAQCDVYLPASNTLLNQVRLKLNNWAVSDAILTARDTWTTMFIEVPDSSAVGANSSIEVDGYANGAYQWTGNGTDSIYIKNAILIPVGCLVDSDCGQGSGYVLPDIQGRFPLVIDSGSFSNFQHTRPSNGGRFQSYINTTTPTLIGGLPANARIMAVVFIPASPVTVRMGYASGGVEIIAAGSPLEVGRNEPPLKTRYTSATGQIWVTLSAAVATDIVVIYDVLPGLTTAGAGDNLPMGEQIGYLEVFSAADQPIGATETTLAFATAGSSAGNGIALVGGNTIRVTRPGRIEFTVQLQMAHTNTTTTNVWLTQSNPTSSPVNEMGITIQGVASTERPSTFTGRIVSVASVANPIDYQIHAKSLATGTSLNFRSDVDNSPGSSSPAIKVLVALYKN